MWFHTAMQKCTSNSLYTCERLPEIVHILKWNSQTELCSQKHRLRSFYKDTNTSIHAMPFNILNSLSVFNSLWEVQTVYFHVCLLPWLIDYFLFPLQWHMQVNAAQREPWVFVASFSLNLVIFSLSLSFCCFVLKEVCLTITSAFLSAFF